MEEKKFIENSVSSKEVILHFIDFVKMLARNWRVIMIGFLVGAIISLAKSLSTDVKATYKSFIVFNLELGGGGGMGQLGGLANAFGIGGGNGVAGGDLFTSQNFPTIVRSRVVLERALMSEVVVNGDSTLLINYVIDSSDIKTNEWAGDLFHQPFHEGINYKFTKNKLPNEFTPLENVIIGQVYDKLFDATTVENVETTSSIIQLNVTLNNEKLANVWAKAVLEATEKFYVEMRTKKTRNLLKVQENRLAEIRAQLNSTDKRIARINYENPNVVDPSAQFKEAQINRSSTFLNNQYMTQLATIEGLNRILIEQTPLFTIMEESRLPLETELSSGGIPITLLSIACLLLTIGGLFFRNTYKSIMNS